VQYEIDTPLTKLTRQIGKVNAFRAWRRSRLAVDALAARLTDLNVPDVMPRNSLFLAGNELDRDDLSSEHDADTKLFPPGQSLQHPKLAISVRSNA
jgi:hypothetical protein